MELFSQEYFERVVRHTVPPDAPETLIQKSAADMRNCVDMGFKDGLAGSPMRQHERDKHASRAQQRYAKSLYELYRLGYKLGKVAM